jgi:hypothetical protein
MKKVLMVAIALMVAAAPAFAQDKKAAAKGTEKAAAAKTMSAMGTVSAVSADSLTVKGKTDEWTFAVDSKTNVQAKGASHATAAAKAESKPTPITDFVHVGDSVSVKYHDGATKHASSVMVTSAKPAAAKK